MNADTTRERFGEMLEATIVAPHYKPTFRSLVGAVASVGHAFGLSEIDDVAAWYIDLDSSGETNATYLVKLIDGRWAACHAWSDYTGWDCQSSVQWSIGTYDDVVRYGMGDEDRERLGIALPETESA
jgi:hypothetical protein